MKTRKIKRHVEKTCSDCGKTMKVILYADRHYRGGHYFGEIPISTKKEVARVLKLGTRTVDMGGWQAQVLKEDPKPYKYVEHWECPKCYWRY